MVKIKRIMDGWWIATILSITLAFCLYDGWQTIMLLVLMVACRAIYGFESVEDVDKPNAGSADELSERLYEVTYQVENLCRDMMTDLAIQGIDKPTFALSRVNAAYIELLAAHFPDEEREGE